MSTDQTMFRKESAKAKNQLTLEGLKFFREKTAARLVSVRSAGIFTEEDINRVEASLADYDRRIARRERKLARQAKKLWQKEAQAAGLI